MIIKHNRFILFAGKKFPELACFAPDDPCLTSFVFYGKDSGQAAVSRLAGRAPPLLCPPVGLSCRYLI